MGCLDLTEPGSLKHELGLAVTTNEGRKTVLETPRPLLRGLGHGSWSWSWALVLVVVGPLFHTCLGLPYAPQLAGLAERWW